MRTIQFGNCDFILWIQEKRKITETNKLYPTRDKQTQSMLFLDRLRILLPVGSHHSIIEHSVDLPFSKLWSFHCTFYLIMY